MAKKTMLDEVIDDMNTEIEADFKAINLKKAFRDQLVAKRNEKTREVKVDSNGTTEED